MSLQKQSQAPHVADSCYKMLLSVGFKPLVQPKPLKSTVPYVKLKPAIFERFIVS